MQAMTSPGAKPALLATPSRLFVETTSRCNLRCPMCVKHSGPGHAPEGDMSPAIFEALEPAFPQLQALILNGIGEPLLHPRLEACIQAGKRSMPAGSWIGFQTNGHLLTQTRASALLEAGLDRIFLSVDATSPELFETVRKGGNLGHVERALGALAQAQKDHPGARLEVGAEFVVMRENMQELPTLVAWLARRGVTRLVVSHLLPFAPAMADQPVFGINAESSELFFKEWSARALQEHIDLTQYFNILWKYKKSPEDLRTIDFVQKISAQACLHDIPFHIGNLIAGEDLSQPESIFRKAASVAAQVGLHLALPALRPLSNHACFAIKHGGMFITWDGKVSPCHFLWRNSSCHLYGREKQVSQRFFGDLSQGSLLGIWNDPAYRQFRTDVLRRRYPHCPGCNVYPCEDIDSADFANDCYGETVPCGDCLWSMGLLQCMGQEDVGEELTQQNLAELAAVRQQLGEASRGYPGGGKASGAP
ncbi:radical SAM/SPASM family putative metalloenzyme maturase [Desulfovibrio sp. TomC]|uniref:radical SAM/SPASM family putative metalloenzyme maturase n=1 Tax=Desulfovibrio sp. TomC TaxID=1562888 RepID=UPI00064D608D|nr:radical SAM/SPASM family putative metalloenzyme maturase [Desulfovibrio sp. TomC]